MSAVIVDHEHIHVLIWAASKPIAPPNPTMRWLYDNPMLSVPRSDEHGGAFGR